MEIEFNKHSRERNLKRRIPVSRIKSAIKLPDDTSLSYRGRKIYRKNFGNKTLEVVTVVEGAKIIVITQYYLKDKL